MKHGYLNALGIRSNEPGVFNCSEPGELGFREEREAQGFDSRETWSLDYTLATWLYSHLKMYKEKAGEVIDMAAHKCRVPVLHEIPEENRTYPRGYPKGIARHYYKARSESKTEEECVDLMIDYIGYYLTNRFGANLELESRAMEKYKCALSILSRICHWLWW